MLHPLIVSRWPFRPRSEELAACSADLVPPLFMRRLETLLSAMLAEDTGRLHSPFEAAVQLLERLALTGVHKHMGSFSGAAPA
jgi:hypothetical protein